VKLDCTTKHHVAQIGFFSGEDCCKILLNENAIVEQQKKLKKKGQ